MEKIQTFSIFSGNDRTSHLDYNSLRVFQLITSNKCWFPSIFFSLVQNKAFHGSIGAIFGRKFRCEPLGHRRIGVRRGLTSKQPILKNAKKTIITQIFDFKKVLEIPASRVFLGADAQLLGNSLASVRKSLSMHLNHCLVLCQHHASETKYVNI